MAAKAILLRANFQANLNLEAIEVNEHTVSKQTKLLGNKALGEDFYSPDRSYILFLVCWQYLACRVRHGCGCDISCGTILDLGKAIKSTSLDGFFWDLCLWTKINGLNLPYLRVNLAPNWVSLEDSMGGLDWNSVCFREHEVGEHTHDDQAASKE